MRRTSWITAIMTLAIVTGTLAIPSAPVQAETSAEFMVQNDTGWWLTIYLNGSLAMSVPPRERSVTLLSPGWYTMKAVTTDGQSVERNEYVGEGGFTWTIYEEGGHSR